MRVEPAGRGPGPHRGPARRPGRVHQGPAGRGRRRGDPVGRGVPAAADHGAGVRGGDRREGPSRRAPRALDPDAPGGLLRRPRGRRPRRGDAGGGGPELRRVQVDRRLPHGPGRRRPERGRGPRGLRGVARGRVARDPRARQARPRLPDPPHPGGGQGARPGVPLPLRGRGPGHRPRARQAAVPVPVADRRAGPARGARAQRVPVGPGGGLHRLGAAERLPGAVRADPVGVRAGRVGARDAGRDRAGRQAPVRLGRGGGARGVLDLGAARAPRPRTRPGPVRRTRLRHDGPRRASRRDGAGRELPGAARSRAPDPGTAEGHACGVPLRDRRTAWFSRTGGPARSPARPPRAGSAPRRSCPSSSSATRRRSRCRR